MMPNRILTLLIPLPLIIAVACPGFNAEQATLNHYLEATQGMLATSKSGTLLLRRDQGDVAVL